MGWPTKFSKTQISEALDRGQQDRVVNNGWVRLNSSTSNPICLGTLIASGNYITSYWTDGPSLGEDIVSPADIVVTLINGETHQFLNVGEKKFHRVITTGAEVYGNWELLAIEGATNPGPTAPIAPIDGKTLWLDTSNPNMPSFKVFINGFWKEIIPEGSMKSSIYDQNNKQTDIFKYIDDAILDASLSALVNEFASHINNNDIHTSATEKAKWNSAPSNTDVNNAVSTMKTKMKTATDSIISENISKVNSLTTTITGLNTNIDTHADNANIHPSAEKQAEWDSKSNTDHTHNLDGRVTVDISRIDGEIQNSVLPTSIKERVYIVKSVNEMYALQKNPVHNGDFICVEPTGGSATWYYVVDDTYLGTNSAAIAFKQVVFSGGDITWNSITGIPTTLAGYGITDSATKQNISSINSKLDTIAGAIDDHNYSTAAANKTFYENAVTQLETLAVQIPLILDPIVTKLEEVVSV